MAGEDGTVGGARNPPCAGCPLLLPAPAACIPFTHHSFTPCSPPFLPLSLTLLSSFFLSPRTFFFEQKPRGNTSPLIAVTFRMTLTDEQVRKITSNEV